MCHLGQLFGSDKKNRSEANEAGGKGGWMRQEDL